MLTKYAVTQEDIDRALHSITACPIATCLRRSGHSEAIVGIHNGHYVARCKEKDGHWVYLPPIADGLAATFDEHIAIVPIEFEFDCDGPNALADGLRE